MCGISGTLSNLPETDKLDEVTEELKYCQAYESNSEQIQLSWGQKNHEISRQAKVRRNGINMRLVRGLEIDQSKQLRIYKSNELTTKEVIKLNISTNYPGLINI